jgi:hypothetical protein
MLSVRFLLVLLVCGASSVAAQPSAEALRLEPGERVRIDGRLDEPFWDRALPLADFLQQEPNEGAAPTERTEVRIAFDRENLYIGVVLHDSDPSGILGHQRQRNAGLGNDDRFMWILDTFRDGRTAYFFEINPAGLMGDGLLRLGSGVNKSWDGIWETRVVQGDFGWSAEIRIPFRTLNFNPELDSWGINFQRTVRRKNEEILWAGHRRNQGLTNPAHAGRLTGLHDLSQGLGLEVKPYLVASTRQSAGPDGSGWETPADLGVDIGYSLTPSLRAALSVNTDFAEVEVDQRRVNLSRFPLRFPEQREFFLEGSRVFDFSPGNGVEPYFSRRIGLVGGEPVPVRFGARLAGQAGAYDLGFLQVRTGAGGGQEGEDFTVARAVRNLFAQSSIGGIFTRRTAAAEGGPGDAHTAAADLELSTARFLGDRNLRFQAFYVWHDDAMGTGSGTVDRSAHGLRLTYPNDTWSGHVSYRQLGDAFSPAMGFTPRRGFRRIQPSLNYSIRPEWLASVRRLDWGVRGEYLTDLQGELQTGSFGVGLLTVRFESGDYVSLDRDASFERLRDPFRLHPDTSLHAVVPGGEHTFGGWRLYGSTTGRRALSASGSLSHGGFWTGERTQVTSGLVLRPGPGVTLSMSGERNRVNLPEASFDTDLLRAGAGWHMNPSTSLTGTVQYDNVSEAVGLYGRLRWIVRPGSDLYLVYTHNWNAGGDAWETLQRGAASKLTYTHRF